MRTSKSKAFSLIELSIVILIIGILIAGVTQGSRLIAQMKLNTARSLTKSAPVASIKGLSLWLETTSEESFADSETQEFTTATTLANWYDINPQSSAKLTGTTTASAAGDVYYKASGINGLPTVAFKGGTTSRIALSSVPAVTGDVSTAFIVYRDISASTATQRSAFWNGSAATAGWGYIKTTDGTNDGARQVATGTAAGEIGSAMTSVPEIASITIAGPGAAAALYINGTAVSLTDGTLASFSTSTAFTIGNYFASSAWANPWKGYISEIIMYDGVLKAEDRKAVEDYLGKKYGIKVR